MIGINEIIKKLITKKPLTEEEKFKILHSKRINPNVIVYLISILENLHIEVLGKYEGSLFELMVQGKLEGWCWQTTSSAIVFFNDDDYIERGYLNFDERTPKYYHSWICFNFNRTEYVLDPCFSFLCKKEDYTKIFAADVRGRVSAKAVKEELIKQLTTPKKEDDSEAHQIFNSFLKNVLGDSYDSYLERKKDEVIVDGPEDVNTPFYRNGSGYKSEIEDGMIRKLTVHYYHNDC